MSRGGEDKSEEVASERGMSERNSRAEGGNISEIAKLSFFRFRAGAALSFPAR